MWSSCHLMSRICVLSHVRSLLRGRLIGWQDGNWIAMLKSLGETESGSAGTQPDKGYPGRRCAKGAVGPWRVRLSGAFLLSTLWTPEACLRKSICESPTRLGQQKKIRLLFVLEAPGCVRKVGMSGSAAGLCRTEAMLCSAIGQNRGQLQFVSILSFFSYAVFDRAVIRDDGFMKQLRPPGPTCDRFPGASPSARE